ncbi:MAG: glycosyltransferase [candidate division WOR-3 bacterium]
MKIVYASYNPFTPEVRVGAHYYSSLMASEGHSVLYLADPDFIFHHLDKREHVREGCREWYRIKRMGAVRLPEGPVQYLPSSLIPTLRRFWPFNTPRAALAAARVTWPSVKGVARKLGFSEPDLFWIENVRYLYLREKLGAPMLVQRVHDMTLASPVEKTIRDLFVESLRKSSVVFCMSKSLMDDYIVELCRDPHKVHYLPNGVSEKWFSVPKNLPEPPDLSPIPKPRVIMVGVYEFWVDYQKLWQVARALPDVSFIMVGPLQVILPADKPENIHFLGKRPHEIIPAYLRNSDVGLSIFARTPFTEYVNLIKLYEYLAMGLPAVSTAHRELSLIDAPWRLADSPEDFVRAIRESLEVNEDERKGYVDFARANTWERRFDTVKEVLGL